jgi:adenylate cyclase
LRNFHWKNPADVTHYRDGLLKAGVPFNKAFAESTPRGTRDS